MHLYAFTWLAMAGLCAAKQWPYDRYRGATNKKGRLVPDRSIPEFKDEDPLNEFGRWFHRIVDHKNIGGLQELFVNGSVPDHATFEDIWQNLAVPEPPPPTDTVLPPHIPWPWPKQDAASLFPHLPFDLDPRCTADRSKW